MDVIEAIYQRQSVRDYKPDAVPREVIDALVAAAVHAPSAMNLQPWAFIVIEGREILARYAERAKRHLLESRTSPRRWPAIANSCRTRPSTSSTARPLCS